MIMSKSDQLAYGIPDACRVSGLGRSMLYVEIAAGRLRAVKCGSRTLILRSDLERFLGGLPDRDVQADAA
jgi:excisionase family DNA binding protein